MAGNNDDQRLERESDRDAVCGKSSRRPVRRFVGEHGLGIPFGSNLVREFCDPLLQWKRRPVPAFSRAVCLDTRWRKRLRQAGWPYRAHHRKRGKFNFLFTSRLFDYCASRKDPLASGSVNVTVVPFSSSLDRDRFPP